MAPSSPTSRCSTPGGISHAFPDWIVLGGGLLCAARGVAVDQSDISAIERRGATRLLRRLLPLQPRSRRRWTARRGSAGGWTARRAARRGRTRRSTTAADTVRAAFGRIAGTLSGRAQADG